MTDKINLPKFKNLRISRNIFSTRQEIKGEISYDLGKSSVQFELTEDQALSLLNAVSDLMVEMAKENAELLQQDVLEFQEQKVLEKAEDEGDDDGMSF